MRRWGLLVHQGKVGRCEAPLLLAHVTGVGLLVIAASRGGSGKISPEFITRSRIICIILGKRSRANWAVGAQTSGTVAPPLTVFTAPRSDEGDMVVSRLAPGVLRIELPSRLDPCGLSSLTSSRLAALRLPPGGRLAPLKSAGQAWPDRLLRACLCPVCCLHARRLRKSLLVVTGQAGLVYAPPVRPSALCYLLSFFAHALAQGLPGASLPRCWRWGRRATVRSALVHGGHRCHAAQPGNTGLLRTPGRSWQAQESGHRSVHAPSC